MPVTRERVDPIRTPDELGLVHRRWILPDDVTRAVPLLRISSLWRGLLELGVLDASAEARVERASGETQEMPARASAGALLVTGATASLVTQVVWIEQGHRDPYGEEDGYRDYTLYAVDSPRHLFLPIPPVSHWCAACAKEAPLDGRRFGEGELVDLGRVCSCGATLDPARDKATLRSGAVFLLEELVCRAALSIEMPEAPEAEELPDASVAALVREAFGGTDELADDQVEAAT